jgi:hypothetical protein
MKTIWIRFFPQDWLLSNIRRRLNHFDRGVYFDLLCLLYTSPMPGYACETCGDDLRFLTMNELALDLADGHAGTDVVMDALNRLAKYGGICEDEVGIHNPRAVEEGTRASDQRRKSAAKASKAAKARWMPQACSKHSPKQCSKDATSNAEQSRVEQSRVELEAEDTNTISSPSETHPKSEAPGVTVIRIPYQEIYQAYQDTCGQAGLTIHRGLSDTMKRQIKARWNQKIKAGNYRSDDLEFWLRYFQLVVKCPFLCGTTGTNFRADLMWLTGRENIDKVLGLRYLPKGAGADKPKSSEDFKHFAEMMGLNMPEEVH